MPSSHLASRRQLHVKFHLLSCSRPPTLRDPASAQKPEVRCKLLGLVGLFTNHARHHRSMLCMLPAWHCMRNVAQNVQRMRVHECGCWAGVQHRSSGATGPMHCCSGFKDLLAMNTGPRYGRKWLLSVQMPWHAGSGSRRESSACGAARMWFSLRAGCMYGWNCVCWCCCRPCRSVAVGESSMYPSLRVRAGNTGSDGQLVHVGVCVFVHVWRRPAVTLGDRVWLVPAVLVLLVELGCLPGACQPGLSLSGGSGWYRFVGSPKVM